MKEIFVRSLSGLLYVALLLASLFNEIALTSLLFVFGLVSIAEFKKLISLKSQLPYLIFTILYAQFGYWQLTIETNTFLAYGTQILLVISLFVLLFLIRDLFTEKEIPLIGAKPYLLTTFYVATGFLFLLLIPYYNYTFTPKILFGTFIIIWVNDTFAYLVGKNFGKQKLFERISPKKTIEGFLGGLFFACLASYFITTFTKTLNFSNWLILSVIISVFGTLGDLVESKFKRQANVKDSGVIMPGHGGLLDRLDSLIFAAPFIYLFLSILDYVS